MLFLVDRLELEDQAEKAFKKVLANDFKTIIYKENRDSWRHAEIVVTTVQSLSYEWIVPSSGQVILAGTITGGGVRTFDSSFLQSDAVLYIHR